MCHSQFGTLAFGVIVLGTASVMILMSIHKVNEGHVGVYFRGGALLDEVTDPGYHLKLPFVTAVYNVQTTLQTDQVEDIPCGTSGGVSIFFEVVEVVNRLRKDSVLETVRNYSVNYDRDLIFKKINSEINQFCSGHTLQEVYIDKFDTVDERLRDALQQSCTLWAPGIEIIAVRVTKPKIPDRIRANYEEMEAEKTKLLVAEQRQKVVIKEAETEKKRATIEAEKLLEVSKIRMQQQVSEKESQHLVATIEDTMYVERQQALADAEAYHRQKQAEANKLLLSPEFLQQLLYQSISNNTKIYFGPSIPQMFLDSIMDKKGSVGATVPEASASAGGQQ